MLSAHEDSKYYYQRPPVFNEKDQRRHSDVDLIKRQYSAISCKERHRDVSWQSEEAREVLSKAELSTSFRELTEQHTEKEQYFSVHRSGMKEKRLSN